MREIPSVESRYLDEKCVSRTWSVCPRAAQRHRPPRSFPKRLLDAVLFPLQADLEETGLRLALGAGTQDILSLVLGEGLKRTAWGIACGLVAAFAAGHGFRSLLFGVEAADPVTYAGVAALVLAINLAACFVPAWWAARLDPVRALRQD